MIPAVATARRRSRVNLVVDGNSISANYYTSIGTMDEHLILQDPLTWATVSHSCFAVSGDRWTEMVAEHGTLVDAAYDETDGVTNVLVAWETTNQVTASTATVTTCLTKIAEYTTARRAAHDGWIILYVGTLPCGGGAAYADENNNLLTVDAAVEADPASYGLDAFVDLRVHPAFDHDGTTAAAFDAYPTFWEETEDAEPRYFLHPRDPGKAVIAPIIAAAIADLI